MTPLPIPEAARRDPRSLEMLRVWAAEKGQHVAIKTGLWDDPFIWGMMLVDLARHIALAHEQLGRANGEQFLEGIRRGFDAEWDHPTDRPKGGVVDYSE